MVSQSVSDPLNGWRHGHGLQPTARAMAKKKKDWKTTYHLPLDFIHHLTLKKIPHPLRKIKWHWHPPRNSGDGTNRQTGTHTDRPTLPRYCKEAGWVQVWFERTMVNYFRMFKLIIIKKQKLKINFSPYLVAPMPPITVLAANAGHCPP